MIILLLVWFAIPVLSQNTTVKITDSNTALHAMQPDYKTPYGPAEAEDITAVLNRLFEYIDASTPATVIDKQTGAEIIDMRKLTSSTVFEQGVFRLISYEWGVAYGAMLLAGEVTGDSKFTEYTTKRMDLISSVARFYKTQTNDLQRNSPVRSVLDPRALDDAGSMCAAMIKTADVNNNQLLRPLIDNYIDYISNKQQRLSDGTLSRNRPLPDAIWLDDLYMSVPALAQMGKLTGEKKYFDDACRQITQFSGRMFNKTKGLYMHGWIQGMDPHPEFYWGRCNGWALLAISELLDVLPSDHPSVKAMFVEYQTSLNLQGRNNFGTLTAANYDEYLLKNYLFPSAEKYLNGLSDEKRNEYLDKNKWIVWRGKTVTFIFKDYAANVGRMKGLPAFDDFEMKQPEPNLFGNKTSDSRHFTNFSLQHSTGNPDAEIESEVKELVNMMNAMYFIRQKNEACAGYWWLRNGTSDNHTSQTVMVNLATSLENLDKKVNALLFWDGGHCADNDPEGFIEWIGEITGNR